MAFDSPPGYEKPPALVARFEAKQKYSSALETGSHRDLMVASLVRQELLAPERILTKEQPTSRAMRNALTRETVKRVSSYPFQHKKHAEVFSGLLNLLEDCVEEPEKEKSQKMIEEVLRIIQASLQSCPPGLREPFHVRLKGRIWVAEQK